MSNTHSVHSSNQISPTHGAWPSFYTQFLLKNNIIHHTFPWLSASVNWQNSIWRKMICDILASTHSAGIGKMPAEGGFIIAHLFFLFFFIIQLRSGSMWRPTHNTHTIMHTKRCRFLFSTLFFYQDIPADLRLLKLSKPLYKKGKLYENTLTHTISRPRTHSWFFSHLQFAKMTVMFMCRHTWVCVCVCVRWNMSPIGLISTEKCWEHCRGRDLLISPLCYMADPQRQTVTGGRVERKRSKLNQKGESNR